MFFQSNMSFYQRMFMQVLSRSGKMEVLTNAHRPYGSNKVSLQEIRRINEAGGWVCFLHSTPLNLPKNSPLFNSSTYILHSFLNYQSKPQQLEMQQVNGLPKNIYEKSKLGVHCCFWDKHQSVCVDIGCILCLQIVNGRICGDISVSRAFGDMRFKTKKNEYVLSDFLLS